MSDNFFVILCLIGLIAIGIYIPLTLAAERKLEGLRELRERARADFETARGTIHLRLLTTIQNTLQQQIQDAESRLSEQQKALVALDRQQHEELYRTITRQLVLDELHTLPGIGPRLANSILEQVFKGELSDLGKAYLVEGIGPQKQSTIDRWRMEQAKRLPTLLEGGFSGKNSILRRYNQEKSHLNDEIRKVEKVLHDWRTNLSRVNEEVAKLSKVTLQDFEQALAAPDTVSDAINSYQLGTFPPWEPMPDWFVQALEFTDSRDTLSSTN